MATYDPTQPPKSLQEVLAAATPEPEITGETRILTPGVTTMDVATLLALMPPSVLGALGVPVKIDGYLVEGGGYDTATQALIAATQAAGWPNSSILVNVLGTVAAGTTGSFALPSVTVAASVSAPSLVGLQVGSFSLPSVSLTPSVSAATLTGVQAGTFTLPSVSVQPVVAVPSLEGVQAGVGSFSLPAVSLTPSVAAPSLIGVQVGSFALPSVTAQPVIAAPSMTGVQVGAFTLPSVSAQPTVAAPSLVGVQVGSFALPAVSLTPVVAAASLVGISASTGSFAIPAVSVQPTVAAPSLVGVEVSAPTQPVISATGGDTQVTIALVSGGTGATSYDLKWGTSAGSRPNTISGITLPYTHTGRTNGTTYYYSVVASNASGSTESAEVSAEAAVAATTIYADSAFSYPTNTLGDWSTMRSATQGAGVITDNLLISAERFWNVDEFEERVIVRAGIAFTVPQGAALTSATLHLYVESLYAAQQPQISVQESSHNAASADFADYDAFPGAPNGTSFGNTAAVSGGQSYSITLNASGLAYLNGLRAAGGTAKFMLREYGHDFQNVEPGIDQYFTAYLSMPNHANVNQRPKLVVS